jgi:acetylornithine deacetylase
MLTLDRQEIVATLTDLVRTPSINPSLVPGADGERALAEAIAARLRQTSGITVELQAAGDGRPNVIASTGAGRGRTLLLNGHIDTVGVVGMDEPFSGRVEGNRLYGRGSDDMKASMAVAIVLLEALAREGTLPGRLVVTFVVDEEHSSIGTAAICREIDRWQPDGALVIEPSGLKITTAHKGFVWATLTTHGFAAHGSNFRLGRDAIAAMGPVIVAFDEYCRALLTRQAHPVVGPPSAHCSLISGGQELSSYPEACRLEIERRTIPGETVEQVQRELEDILAGIARQDTSFRADLEMGVVRRPFEVERAAPIVTELARAFHEELGREPEFSGAAGWMDSALLSAAGVPCAIFGPAGAGGHGLVEWTDLDSVADFARVVTRFVDRFCR